MLYRLSYLATRARRELLKPIEPLKVKGIFRGGINLWVDIGYDFALTNGEGNEMTQCIIISSLVALGLLTGSISSVLAATTNNNAIQNTASVNEIQQRIDNNQITQPNTGIMVVDPDTLVAAGATGQNAFDNNAQPSSPRVSNGLAVPQSKQMLNALDAASDGNTIVLDPDSIAATKAAASVAGAASNNTPVSSATTSPGSK